MEKQFKTKDLYEAAALESVGVFIFCLEWIDGQCFFVFSKYKEANFYSGKFWSSQLNVDAREYAMSVRRLKDRLFSKK